MKTKVKVLLITFAATVFVFGDAQAASTDGIFYANNSYIVFIGDVNGQNHITGTGNEIRYSNSTDSIATPPVRATK